MDEEIFTGYCRSLDQTRMVTVEREPGAPACIDCSYGSCAFQSSCQLAMKITEYLES